MSITYPDKVQGGSFYLGDNLEMTTKTVVDSVDETISKTFNVLDTKTNGVELPTVTSDDNGDVLTVVDGAWAKAVPSGGGASILQTLSTTAINETAEVVTVSQDGNYIATSNIWTNYILYGFTDSSISITATVGENIFHFSLTKDDVYVGTIDHPEISSSWGIDKGAKSTETITGGYYLTCSLYLIQNESAEFTGEAILLFAENGGTSTGGILPDGESVSISVPSFNLTVPSNDFINAYIVMYNGYYN